MNKAIYLSTSIPYVNATPHIGYALEAVQTDSLARYYRNILGYDVFFSSGTDDNAIKNVESATKLGITPQELVNRNSKAFERLKDVLNLSFDKFIITSSEEHFKGAQKFWQQCKKEDFEVKDYTGLYCVGCETFYKDGEFEDNICPFHNRPLETVTEKNWFFRLSSYQTRLEKLIENNEIQIFPQHRRSELLNFLKQGLEDISVSRPKERTKGWGVPVPGDDDQIMYVWFDALTNYITNLDYANDGELFHKFWLRNSDRYHIIGKDIVKFHALYWPAMLLSANLPLPTKLFIHGFITVEGQKMSKTLGNVVDPFSMVEKYGTDPVRYFLLREIPSLGDGDYSERRMLEVYDAELANELGNLVSRLTTLAEKNNYEYVRTEKLQDERKITHLHGIEKFEFNKTLEQTLLLVKNLNKYVNEVEPWSKSGSELVSFFDQAITDLHQIAIFLQPFIPQTAQKILTATSGKIAKTPPLFPRK